MKKSICPQKFELVVVMNFLLLLLISMDVQKMVIHLFAELVKERKGAKGLYVLHMENGKPLSKSSLKCLLQMIENRTVDDPADLWTTAPHSKVVRTLDFHVHPHQLRHTYITRLFESGLDIKEIQYLAGHATVNMTLRVYTHYQHESRQQSTAQKVCAAFG